MLVWIQSPYPTRVQQRAKVARALNKRPLKVHITKSDAVDLSSDTVKRLSLRYPRIQRRQTHARSG